MDRFAALFLRFKRNGDVEALGQVFDAMAPRLLPVALHLCGEPASAEDALQETFLVAMQRAETFDPQRRLEPWLVGLLTNIVRNARRHGTRRRTGALPDLAGSGEEPSVAAERTELVAALRTHLDALPHEQRQAVRLRLVHGMAPAEIAEVLEVPPGTVRMRLHRGLLALRKLLPAGLATWLLSMFPARGLAAVRQAVLTAGAKPALALVGVGGGYVTTKLVLGGALALIACIVLWASAAGGSNESSGRVAPPTSAIETAHGTHQDAVTPFDAEGAPPRLAAAGRDLVAASTGALTVTTRSAHALEPGIAVRVLRPLATGFGVWDRATLGRARLVAAGLTDVDGKFVCAVPFGVRVDVRARKGTGVDRHVSGAQGGDVVTIDMDAVGSVRGTLVRQASGLPVRGARVGGFANCTEDRDPLWSAVTDAHGVFVVEAVPTGRYEVEVLEAALPKPKYQSVDVRVGETTELRWIVQEDRATAGRVVAAGTGTPIAGAVVARDYLRRSVVETSSDGSFVLNGFPNTIEPWLFVWAPGMATARFDVADEVPSGGRLELTLQLSPGARIRGQVVDETGAPLEGAYVAAVARVVSPRRAFVSGAWTRRTGQPLWHGAVTDAAGTFRVEGLDPTEGHVLVCTRDGYGTRLLDIGRVAADTELVLPPLALPSAHTIAGRIVASVARGWNVRLLYGIEGESTRPAPGQVVNTTVPERDLLLRDDGRFAFDGLAAGQYELQVVLNGRPLATRAVTVTTDQDVHWLDVPVEAPVLVRVRLGEEGSTHPSALVSACLGNGLVVQHARQKDGAFTMELPAGEYRFEVQGIDAGVAARPVVQRVHGRAMDVRVPLVPASVVLGTVVDTDGKAVPGARVWCTPPGSPTKALVSTTADAEGRFVLRVADGILVDVRASGPAGRDSMRSAAERALVPGSGGLTPNVRAGEVDVRVVVGR